MLAPALRYLLVVLLSVSTVQVAHAQVVLRDTLTLDSPRAAGALQAEAPLSLLGTSASRTTAAPISEGCTYSNGHRSGWRGFWTTEPFLDLNVEFRQLSGWPNFPMSTFVWHAATIQSLYMEYEVYTPLDPHSHDREGEYTVEHVGEFIPFAYWYSTNTYPTPRHYYVMGYDPIQLAEWSNARYIVPVFYFHDGAEWQAIRRGCAPGSYAALPQMPSWTTDVTAYESDESGAMVLDLCINWDPAYPTPNAYCSIGEYSLIVRFRGDKKWAVPPGLPPGLPLVASRDSLLPFWLETYGRSFSPPGYPDQYVHGSIPLPMDTLRLDLCRDGTCVTGNELGRVVQVVGADTLVVPLGQPVPFATLQPDPGTGAYHVFYDGSTATDGGGFWFNVRTRVNGVPQSEREGLMGVLAAECLPSSSARSTTCPATTVRLLAQNDEPVTSGYVMVSKVRPDWLLPEAAQPFASTAYSGSGIAAFPEAGYPGSTEPASTFDPNTYRPELIGLSDTTTVTFQLEVFRQGGPVPIWTDGREDGPSQMVVSYESVGEQQADSTWSYRGTRFLRLVSNARLPEWEEAPVVLSSCASGATFNTPCYDDEVAGLQTIRVAIGDVVRWTAETSDGSLTRAVWTVGKFADTSSMDAAVSVPVRWIVSHGLEVSPNTLGATTRAGRIWSQAGVRLDWEANIVADRLNNVIELDHLDLTDITHQVTTADTLWITVDSVPVPPVPAYAGESISNVGNRLVAALGDAGFPARVVHHAEFIPSTPPSGSRHDIRTLVQLTGGPRFDIATTPTLGGLEARARRVSSESLALLSNRAASQENRERTFRVETHVLALHYGDNDPSTIDFVVVPDTMSTLGTMTAGRAYPDSLFSVSMPTLVNTAVVIASAANGSDRPSFSTPADPNRTWWGHGSVVAHELGHLLLDSGEHHLTDGSNLMADSTALVTTSHEHSPDGPKRLTGIQHQRVRTRSGEVLRFVEAPTLPPTGGRPASPRSAALRPLIAPTTEDPALPRR